MSHLKIVERIEMDEIIRSCKVCYLALSFDDKPYVVPMNFGLDGDYVLFHSAMSGKMWEMLDKNPQICITWSTGEKIYWQNAEVGCSYGITASSVVVEGTAEKVDDYDEKYQSMQKIMAQYSDLTFKFNAPAIRNIGIFKVRILEISGRRFGRPKQLK